MDTSELRTFLVKQLDLVQMTWLGTQRAALVEVTRELQRTCFKVAGLLFVALVLLGLSAVFANTSYVWAVAVIVVATAFLPLLYTIWRTRTLNAFLHLHDVSLDNRGWKRVAVAVVAVGTLPDDYLIIILGRNLEGQGWEILKRHPRPKLIGYLEDRFTDPSKPALVYCRGAGTGPLDLHYEDMAAFEKAHWELWGAMLATTGAKFTTRNYDPLKTCFPEWEAEEKARHVPGSLRG